MTSAGAPIPGNGNGGRSLEGSRDGRDAVEAPVFQDVAVVGTGLIGGSVALAVRRRWPATRLVGVDVPHVVTQTPELTGAFDHVATDLGAIAAASLVVLAAPVRQNIEVLTALTGTLASSAVVTDVGSTKGAIVAEATRLRTPFVFVGGHPLGGAAHGGFAHASASLFDGRPWILTPGDDVPDTVVARLRAFAEGLGARPAQMTAWDHDRLMAFVSHLPQLTASALMACVGGAAGPAGLALSGRGLLDTTRLAASPASVWVDVCTSNADAIRDALDALIDRLTEVRADLGRGHAIEALFADAARWREELLREPR